jgi:hypothetical protein
MCMYSIVLVFTVQGTVDVSHPRGDTKRRSACQIRSSYARHDVLQLAHRSTTTVRRVLAVHAIAGAAKLLLYITAVFRIARVVIHGCKRAAGERNKEPGVLFVLEDLAPEAPCGVRLPPGPSHKGCSCPAWKGRAGAGGLLLVLSS